MDVIWQIIGGVAVFLAGYWFKAFRDRPRVSFDLCSKYHSIYGIDPPMTHYYLRIVHHGSHPIKIEQAMLECHTGDKHQLELDNPRGEQLDQSRRTVNIRYTPVKPVESLSDVAYAIAVSDTGKVHRKRPSINWQSQRLFPKLMRKLKVAFTLMYQHSVKLPATNEDGK